MPEHVRERGGDCGGWRCAEPSARALGVLYVCIVCMRKFAPFRSEIEDID